MVSGADYVDVGWPCNRIYGDFVQLVLGCGQAAVEGLDVCGGLVFPYPVKSRNRKKMKCNFY